ncbi:arylamine N-acetyltransferase [Kitasatospora phosalacinea]|uniref:Arylamine N-acetyltransferase n=1 Tax=Kitasatospora phosalacinea TaxID=2065 RepID=A0A9W6Q941_9ACTN|nr:arylamine N-acetyltransferase [Kitasatospora phosalacinea]GLW70753.1 arylamine N-acetyltransferase [Kitasatospora phosalacinea]
MAERDDEWGAALVDPGGYLRRIGVLGALPPTPETLRRLHRAHQLALPFGNLDPVLGRPVPLEPELVQAKLVERGREGYCFEHNLLFAAVLERLGFRVTRLAARALLNTDRPLPRTHLVLVVAAGAAHFLADVGFGVKGPLEPLPLADGALLRDGARSHLLRRTGSAPDRWDLELRDAAGRLPLYRFEGGPALHQPDCVVMNHYTATHPRSPFTGRIHLTRFAPGRRLTLDGRTLAVERADGRIETARLSDRQCADALAGDFGIRLGPDELAAVLRLLPAAG